MKHQFSETKLCVGVDPHNYLLEKWGLTDDIKGLTVFCQTIIEAVENVMSKTSAKICIKPQLALFERFGSGGLKVLEDYLTSSKTDALVIMDAKRGDIGSTMRGYADAFLKKGAPFEGDALTLSPYLGVESTKETLDLATQNQKTVFLLCLTSNKEAYCVQHAKISDNMTVAKEVFNFAKEYNYIANDKDCLPDYSPNYSPVGLVVGATIKNGAKDAGINLEEFNGPFLCPGFGSQGADISDLETLFGKKQIEQKAESSVISSNSANLVVNSSREILEVGPNLNSLEQKIKQTYQLITGQDL